jgi:putative Holliday junction resolvase
MTDKSNPPDGIGRVAGIDYGTLRIGVAVTDSRRTLASPHTNYPRSGPEADARFFKRLAQEECIVLFVVGLPVHLAGHESAKSLEARRFATWLAEITSIPVVFADERFTSAEADALLSQGEMTSKKRKQRRDMLAAQIMLAGWLEAGQPLTGELKGLDQP